MGLVLMLPSKKRLFVSYILLVGIPLLGIVGVLGAGRSLTAPLSVAGSWELQIDPNITQAQSCVAGLGFTHPTVLEISQSGKYLSLTLGTQPKIKLQAALEGKELVADSTLPVAESCSGAAGLSLRAGVEPKATPRTMSGVLSFDACPSCGAASFRAIRQVFPTGRRSE
jgi:hypothetical protein